MKQVDDIGDNGFIGEIKQLLEEARKQVVRQVNTTMLKTYFEIGRRIVEQEQKGEVQAGYGNYLIAELSKSLSASFGKGYSKRNIELMRQFYLTYKITQSPISQSLSWTHYIRLMRISDEAERRFYEIECEANHWSVRELNRQFDSALYQRLALSRDKEKILELSRKGQILEKIILCRDKKDALVEITLPEDSTQIFASRYQTVLPSKEELSKLIKK
ncbi:DUF1016 N-terminal domain-containing protein [Bacteroides stercorirosoris]|nr:DUF1016 N-terminal domain-containing protein [Bacteroides stercorirosoris]